MKKLCAAFAIVCAAATANAQSLDVEDRHLEEYEFTFCAFNGDPVAIVARAATDFQIGEDESEVISREFQRLQPDLGPLFQSMYEDRIKGTTDAAAREVFRQKLDEFYRNVHAVIGKKAGLHIDLGQFVENPKHRCGVS